MAVLYTPAIGNRSERNNKELAKDLYIPLNIKRNEPRTTSPSAPGAGAGKERPNNSVNLFDWVGQNEVRGLAIAQAPTNGFVTLEASTSLTWDDTYKGKLILLDGGSAAVVATLPPVATSAGAIFFFRSIDGTTNATSVDANSTENLNGGTSAVALASNATLTVVCDGTQWYSI